jgi:exopolysaccharide biosynthesis polyprenyl glycosylphosphotransferase
MSPPSVPTGRLFGFFVKLSVVATDLLSVVLGFLVSIALYQKGFLTEFWLRGRHDPTVYMYVSMGCGVTLVVAASFYRAYERDSSILNIQESLGTLKALMVLVAAAFSATFIVRELAVSRLVLGLGLMTTFVLVFLFRNIHRRVLSALHLRGLGVSNVVIYGMGDTARTLARRMVDSPRFGIRPLAFLVDEPDVSGKEITVGPGRSVPLPVIGSRQVLQDCVQRLSPDGLIVADPSLPLGQLQELISDAKGYGLFVKYVAIGDHVPFRMASFESMGNIPLVGEREVHLSWAHAFAKRLVDILISSLVLLVMAIPLVIISVLIRMTSKGPALFRQERAGYLGHKFTMYKFRTMFADAPAYALKPRSQRDPRISPLGAFLRRSSLDELPQFINVFLGEMSLVGPRPEMPFIVQDYTIEHRERLRVKPGITGLWQISADRDHPIHENIDYDLYYIYHQSILMDLIILVKTLFFAARGL